MVAVTRSVRHLLLNATSICCSFFLCYYNYSFTTVLDQHLQAALVAVLRRDVGRSGAVLVGRIQVGTYSTNAASRRVRRLVTECRHDYWYCYYYYFYYNY